MGNLIDSLSHAWRTLRKTDDYRKDPILNRDIGPSNGYDMSTTVFPRSRYNKAELVNTIFNRLALDVSMVDILHVKIDKSGNQSPYTSGLNDCLTVEANMDQTSRSFIQDLVYSLFDEGVVAVVPIDTSSDITKSGAFDILSMRVGRIEQWYPAHIKVELYNDRTGKKESKILPKSVVAIIDNPLYAITNARNSTLQRLLKKMSLLDRNDEIESQGHLNLIMSMPYAIKTEKQRTDAEKRVADLEEQLKNNKYGIAYTEPTEKITQLNRSISSDVFEQVKYLTEQFYNQIGLTEKVFNGTADEVEIRNYYTRTIDPIVERITSEFKRKFLTKTARSQGQTIVSYRDPFKLVPVDKIAEIGDKFARNAILSSNELRSIVGFRPSNDPEANSLRNPNIATRNQYEDGYLPPAPQANGSFASPE